MFDYWRVNGGTCNFSQPSLVGQQRFTGDQKMILCCKDFAPEKAARNLRIRKKFYKQLINGGVCDNH
jgi:hypothetical protein